MILNSEIILHLKAAGYGEIRYFRNESITESTVGGLTIPGFYNIAASKDRPNVTNAITEKQTKSIYGYANLLASGICCSLI